MSNRQEWMGEDSGEKFVSATCDGCGSHMKYGGYMGEGHDWCGACWEQRGIHLRVFELEAELTVQTDRAEGRLHRIDALEKYLAEAREGLRIVCNRADRVEAERDAAAARAKEAESVGHALFQDNCKLEDERDTAVANAEDWKARHDAFVSQHYKAWEGLAAKEARLTRLERVAEKARDWLLQLPSPLDERPYRRGVVDALRAIDEEDTHDPR